MSWEGRDWDQGISGLQTDLHTVRDPNAKQFRSGEVKEKQILTIHKSLITICILDILWVQFQFPEFIFLKISYYTDAQRPRIGGHCGRCYTSTQENTIPALNTLRWMINRKPCIGSVTASKRTRIVYFLVTMFSQSVLFLAIKRKSCIVTLSFCVWKSNAAVRGRAATQLLN